MHADLFALTAATGLVQLPTLPWRLPAILVVALPLLGFLLNGALALWRPGAKTAVSIIVLNWLSTLARKSASI